jgi:hypothetical protein
LFFGWGTTPNEKSLTEAEFSACHQLWGQGSKKWWFANKSGKRNLKRLAVGGRSGQTCQSGRKITNRPRSVSAMQMAA